MRSLLFVITSSANMGDLALCREWIADLGRYDYRYGYVLGQTLHRFIDPRDEQFHFVPEIDVKETILSSAKQMQADGIVFASNAFWNLPGQCGAEFGRFPIIASEVSVPVMSFDPFEAGFEMRLPGTSDVKRFEAVPEWVWALRYMSRQAAGRNDCHFCAKRIFVESSQNLRAATLARWRCDAGQKTIFFPISQNRYDYIQRNHSGYYRHLADVFSRAPWSRAQILVLTPAPVPQFSGLGNVIPVPLIDYDEFLALIGAADLYLTDSLISCIVDAFHLGTPALLLTNSAKSYELRHGTFLEDRFFRYRVFPYGMSEICEMLEQRFEIMGCFAEAEVLDGAEIAAKAEALLFDRAARAEIAARCRRWRSDRLVLPSPREAIERILTQGMPN